jgi:hypothetical protein
MKGILVIFVIFCCVSCKKDKHVWCNCYGGSQNMSFDYGYQRDPSMAANQARCDTDGVHHGYDTCLVEFSDK